MKRILIQLAGQVAEAESVDNISSKITSAFTFLIPVFPILVCAVISFWKTISPWWFILSSLFAVVLYFGFFLFAFMSGQIKGAIYGLQNPRSGETWLDVKDNDEVMWKSKPITPNPTQEGALKVDPINKGGKPKGSLKDKMKMSDPDVMEWHKEAKRILENEPSYKFNMYCKDGINGKKQNPSTVRSRIKNWNL